MKRLKVGIIGLGAGEQHIVGYQQHQNCEVVALCDFSDQKLVMAKKKYPSMHIIKNPTDILQDPLIDIVSIASYDNYHFEQIIKAIKYNKHIFTEKPLCLYEDEAKKIKKALQEKPSLKISSNLVLRTCPRFIRIKDAVRSGKMGRIFYIEGDYLWGRIHKLTDGWRKNMDFYSIVNGAAIHMIDLILWITGMKPQEIKAYGNRIATADSLLQHNSFAAILMRFEDGCIAKVTANGGCVHPHFHKLEIFGTKKTVIHNIEGAKWIENSNPDALASAVTEEYPAKNQRHRVITSFIDSILKDNIQPIVSCDDIFDTMSVCFAAEKAINRSCSVKINYI
jgi:predicted dehydrogenase